MIFKKTRGFTLIETVVTLAVVSLDANSLCQEYQGTGGFR